MRIVSDGTPRRTYLYDSSGALVHGVQRIEWSADVTEPHARARITVFVDVELVAEVHDAKARLVPNKQEETMDQHAIQEQVRKQLRVREPLAARELAERCGVSTNTIASSLHELVRAGLAVRHPGSTQRGDRAARYTKPSAAFRLSKGQAARS